MLNSEKENTSPVPPIRQEQDYLADAKRRLTLEVPNKISRRKSVENLVISSHDAIGQSISHALSFSGAITQQASQHNSSEHRSVSRSPSPCRRPAAAASPILEHGDYLGQNLEVGNNSNSTRYASDTSSQVSSPPQSLSVSTPLPSDPSLPCVPLQRSASQEVQPRQPSTPLPPTPTPTPQPGKSQESRSKKKSWYSALYPTYKSRSEDFKKIFKDVPDDERLIVDYSCAIQKDILVHGRLYVSQNYLCFYANIFRWETFLSLRWKDVTAITKEKTALVIPNAILICTDNEKHFLTSFAGRDKTYLMLFRIWQNALMDQPMSTQEMWQWVHICYGEELGFNSDDEDYPQNFLEEDKLCGMRLSAESIAEDFLEHGMDQHSTGLGGGASDDNLPCAPAMKDDFDSFICPSSDSSQSEGDKPISFGADLHKPLCTNPHDGKKFLSVDFHVHIDQLFTMLFTNSKFYIELLAMRKTTDLVQNAWKQDAETGLKSRKVSFTLVLNQSVGPKTAQVTETQVMLACTRPGYLYSIEISSSNAGIPYADSFTVEVHYCLKKVAENITNIQVFGHVKYKKSVWTVVKTFIEKNCWAGLDEYLECLSKAIVLEVEEDHVTSKRKSRRKRRGIGATRESGAELETVLGAAQLRPVIGSRHRSPGSPLVSQVLARTGPSNSLLWAVLAALSLLVVVNAALYWKLWGIEGARWLFETEDRYASNVLGSEANPTPEIIAEWSKHLKEQSTFHMGELDRWRKALNDAISLLKQTETALANLQSIIQPSLEKIHPPNSHPNSEL